MRKTGLHILGMIALTMVLIVGLNASFGFITNHGQKQEVPDLSGKTLEEAENILEEQHLRYFIADSTFDVHKKPHEVIDQHPVKGSFVKRNRKIYITVNSIKPPLVKLPNLIDMSKRQAQLVLENSGFLLGKEIYQPDLAKDAVLSMRANGNTVAANTSLPKGTTIDLILGDGMGVMDVEIPDLIGLTVMEAMTVLDAVHLSVGNIEYDEGVTDQLQAYVYYQQPEYGSKVKMSAGDPINLFATKKIPENITK